MATPINLPVNAQLQNQTQLQRQILQATQNLRINFATGNSARSLGALSQPLGRLTGQADEFTKSLDAANARVLAFGASVGIVNTLSNAFKSLVTSTIEVEKAITAISVVGDQFAGKNKQLSQGLFSIAKATGQSFAEVSKAALEFSRQGLKLEDTLQRTQDALILTRLTGLDASKSVDGLTASVNAFSKAGLSTTQILNKLAAVDQAFAVSSADLIEGFNRSAAVAQNAGVTFDELAGIITALQQETSRGGAVIGNALKTIFTRLQDTSTLNQLRGLGVAVQDLEGNLLPARQILQNLAKDVEGLGQITRAGVFKDVAGTFQINQLISLVGDLGKANSVSAKATQVAAGATNEAFIANEKLNQSLDAIINKVALTGKQLGALLGEIGLGDNLKGILDGINSFLEGATNLLQGDDLGSRFAKGIIKGIGSVLTGPGIGLFLAIIAKLSFDLAKFGVQSLKTFFGIGQAAKQQQQVQESIVQTLIRNQSVLSQILNTQGGQNAQAQAFLNILKQEEQVLQNIRTIAAGIAAPLVQQGYRAGTQGIQKRSAGGYLPAQEASDVRRGIGGASPNSKVVAIPNFAFGGGKRGTMIANTSEYIVPNYAGGGSAIFNQDMAKTMGLPPGARKISAAGGFIPNFANFAKIGQDKIDFSNYSVSEIAARDGQLDQKNKVDSIDEFFGIIDILRQKRSNFDYTKASQRLLNQFWPKNGDSKASIQLRKQKFDNVIKSLEKRGVDNQSINRIKTSYASGNYRNTLFQIKGVLGELDASKVSGQDLAGNNAYLDLLGGGEVKTRVRTPLSNLIKKAANNFLKNPIVNYRNEAKDKINLPKLPVYLPSDGEIDYKASGGYIPNFANYVYDSDRLGGDKQKILQAILDSTKKKDLLVGPAGAGKSTLGSGLGTFISSIDDISKASSFTILSGAALTKEKGLSQDLRAKLAAVQASGGKVSYLGVTNQELLSRREKRATEGSVEGDLRSAAQLAGSKLAPLNQGAFIRQLKRSSSNFELLRESKQQASTNQQLAILGLYGENGNINGSPVYTLKSQRPNLFKDIEGNLKKNVTNLVKAYANRIGKKIGIPVGAKDIKKSLTQIPSLSGYMFEDVLNQLAGPNFDTATESSGSRIDFPLTKNLREVFGVTGAQIYAEAKLNPYSPDALKSIADKQLALAGGAQGPVERSGDLISGLKAKYLAYKNLPGRTKGNAENKAIFNQIVNSLGLDPTTPRDTLVKQVERILGAAAEGYIPNFVDLNKSESYISAQRKRSFQASTYRKASGVIGSLFKILPEKFFTDGVLGDAVNGAETNGILKAIKDSSYYMASFAGPKAVNFVAQAEKNGLKVSEGLKKKLAQLTVKAATKINRSSEGYVPNFAASALLDAISREKSAGLSASQIYVDQSPALKSSSNPMGLMVANRRDEPAGGFQGIARARKEGMNPKTYGAALGFVPNYAVQAPLRDVVQSDINNRRKMINDSDLAAFNAALKSIAQELKKGKITLQEAGVQIDSLSKSASSSKVVQNKLNSAAKNLITAYDGEIKSRQQQAKDLRKTRADIKANKKSDDAPTGQFADLAGKLVVAQTGLSFFAGALEGTGGTLEKFGTATVEIVGKFTQLIFLLQGLGGQKLLSKITEGFSGVFKKVGGSLGRSTPTLGKFAAAAGPYVAGLAGIGFLINGIGEAVKDITRKDVGSTLEKLSNSAAEAEASLTELGKKTANEAKKLSNKEGGFSSYREIYTLGLSDSVTRGGITYADKELKDNELAQIFNQLATSYVAAGSSAEDANKQAAAFIFNRRISDESGIVRTDLTSEQSAKDIDLQIKRNAVLGRSRQATEAYAEAQALAGDKTKTTIDLYKNSAQILSFVNTQYNALKNTILGIDLDSAFAKFSNKTLLELDSSLSSAQKSVAEFNNSLREAEIDFNVDQAKAFADQVEKINTATREGLIGLEGEEFAGQFKVEEVKAAVEELQTIFTNPSSSLEQLQEFLGGNAQKLAGIFKGGTEEIIKQFEELKKQTAEQQRQYRLKQAQAKLDFANKTLADQQTLLIQKQNGVLEKRLSILQKTFDQEGELLDIQRQISDVEFETGLIGQSQTAQLSARRGRVSVNQERATADIIREFKKALVDELTSIEIPDTLSPDAALALKDQRNTLAQGILNFNGQGLSPEIIIASLQQLSQAGNDTLINEITSAEQEASKIAIDNAITAATSFATIIAASAEDFSIRISDVVSERILGERLEAQEDLYNSPQGLYATPERRDAINDLKSRIARVSAARSGQVVTPFRPPESPKSNAEIAAEEARGAVAKRAAQLQAQMTAAIKEHNDSVAQGGTTAEKAALFLQKLQLALKTANKDFKDLTQQIGELGDATLILSQRITQYLEGLPGELAGLRFSALQSTSPDDLASNLIQQNTINQAKAQGKTGEEAVTFIAEENALRQKSFELQTAESASRRRELEIELRYLEEFFALKKETANLSEEEQIKALANLKRRQIEEQRTFGAGFGRGIAQLQTDVDNFQSQLGEQIPQLFSDNLAQGLNDAISGAKSLKDALRDAATSFFQEITRQNISNLAKMFTSGIGNVAKGFFAEEKAAGGLISGGSGIKDDVPAMLMGGEYVIKKSAVKKYGSNFLDALNSGSIKGFANGGGVQSGTGGFYVPGDYGTGGIRGKRQLLSFATQSFTSGQYDTMGGFGIGGASVSLEAESSRLSQFGRQNNPMFERVQESKQQAFDVYLQQLKQEEQYEEQLKEIERREKERQKQLVTSIASAVISSLVKVAAQRMQIGAENEIAAQEVTGQALEGVDKFTTGAKGALKGLFSSQGSALSQDAILMRSVRDTSLQNINFAGSGRNISERPFGSPSSNVNFSKLGLLDFGNDGYYNPYPNSRRYNGGYITGGSGMRDDVPAMLTGGEFVLNNRATRKLGVQNLNRLNAGETGGDEDRSGAVTESLLSKLDELIQATRDSAGDNVVVNVSSNEAGGMTESNSGNEKELQRKIRQAVLDVIAQEKRLGGSLNKDK